MVSNECKRIIIIQIHEIQIIFAPFSIVNTAGMPDMTETDGAGGLNSHKRAKCDVSGPTGSSLHRHLSRFIVVSSAFEPTQWPSAQQETQIRRRSLVVEATCSVMAQSRRIRNRRVSSLKPFGPDGFLVHLKATTIARQLHS